VGRDSQDAAEERTENGESADRGDAPATALFVCCSQAPALSSLHERRFHLGLICVNRWVLYVNKVGLDFYFHIFASEEKDDRPALRLFSLDAGSACRLLLRVRMLLQLLEALPRTIVRGPSPLGRLPLLHAAAPLAHRRLRLLAPSSVAPQRRWGSMKVKRIQRRRPLEKNHIKRLVRGTRLEVKKPKRLEKKKKIRNSDPSRYLTIKPYEFDPLDIRGRSTLIVSAPA